MLVLSRREGERVHCRFDAKAVLDMIQSQLFAGKQEEEIIDTLQRMLDIDVVLVEIRKSEKPRARLGFAASQVCRVMRSEIWEARNIENDGFRYRNKAASKAHTRTTMEAGVGEAGESQRPGEDREED